LGAYRGPRVLLQPIQGDPEKKREKEETKGKVASLEKKKEKGR